MIICITLYNRVLLSGLHAYSHFLPGLYSIDVNLLTQVQNVPFPCSQPSNMPQKAWNKSQSPYHGFISGFMSNLLSYRFPLGAQQNWIMWLLPWSLHSPSENLSSYLLPFCTLPIDLHIGVSFTSFISLLKFKKSTESPSLTSFPLLLPSPVFLYSMYHWYYTICIFIYSFP